MSLTVEVHRAADGEWTASIPEVAGVVAYGLTNRGAKRKAVMLLLRVLWRKVRSGELDPEELLEGISV